MLLKNVYINKYWKFKADSSLVLTLSDGSVFTPLKDSTHFLILVDNRGVGCLWERCYFSTQWVNNCDSVSKASLETLEHKKLKAKLGFIKDRVLYTVTRTL
jgi:hypothetical protein